jgi:hypothetical protein
LYGCREDDAIRDVAIVAILLGYKGEIKQDPPGQTRADFAPGLDVDFTEEWQCDAGVKFTADEEVVDRITGGTPGS